MIIHSNQNWEVGQKVNIGFMKGLVILEAIPTPGDFKPDQYILQKNDRLYSFVPHNGLTRIKQENAR